MKDVWSFIKWQWQRSSYTVTDKLWFLGGFFMGSAAYSAYFHPEEGTPVQLYIGVSCWIIVLLKWIIWDTTKHQWAKFQKEKAELFNTIKESENASKSR